LKQLKLTGKDIIKILYKNGFSIRNRAGSHVNLIGMVKDRKRLVTVAIHGNKEIPPGTLLSIIDQSGFTHRKSTYNQEVIEWISDCDQEPPQLIIIIGGS